MKKIISCILLCLVVLCSFPLLAFAKTEEIVVPVGEGSTSRVFQITWPNTDQEASVTITSPDGTVYSTEQTPEAHCGEGLIVFNVGAAAPGNWVVSITGEGLGTVSVDSGELPGSMEIESFAVEMRGGKAYASWKILDCPESMQLQVYADTDTDGYDGQEVASFTAGAEGEQEISLGGLDGGRYHFYLYVRGEQGIFTRKYAEESLLWFEDSASQELSGVKARMLDGDVFLTWGEVNEDSSYRVMVFAPDNGGLLHDEIVEADTSFLWTLPEQYDGAQAAVALWENGRTGRFTEYPLQRSAQPEATITFPEKDVVNTKTVLVPVEFTGEYTVSAALNGELLVEGGKSGQYRVDMKEGDNILVFYLEDPAGNLFSYVKSLQVDTVPPQLSIQRDLDGLSTPDSWVYLEGHSEQGAQLLLNGQPVSMISGYFQVRCDLGLGDNQITLTAQDAAGNQAQYTAVVSRTAQGSNIMYWIIGGVVFLLLTALYVFLFIRGVKRRKQNEEKNKENS